MTTQFRATYPIRFRSGDPAGISFFANVYPLAHDAFEDFVQALGFEYKEWFQNPDWATPIRHSSCDYFAPLWPGGTVEIFVRIEKLGESSLTLKYLFNSSGQKCAEVTLVHTFIDIKKRAKTTIPSVVRDRLETYEREGLRS